MSFLSKILGGSEKQSTQQQNLFGPQADFLRDIFFPQLTTAAQTISPESLTPGFNPLEQQGQEQALTTAEDVIGGQLVPGATGALQSLFSAPDPTSPIVQNAITGALNPLFEGFESVIAPQIRRASGANQPGGGSRRDISTRLAARDLFNQAGDIASQMALGASQQGLQAASQGLSQAPTVAQLALTPAQIQQDIGQQQRGMQIGQAAAPLDFLSRIQQLFGSPITLGTSQSSGSSIRGLTQGFGDLFGGGGGGSASNALALFSDRRLKTHIKEIGSLPSGIPVYRYHYLWGDFGVGCMADEVKPIIPEAVGERSGYQTVNYNKVIYGLAG